VAPASVQVRQDGWRGSALGALYGAVNASPSIEAASRPATAATRSKVDASVTRWADLEHGSQRERDGSAGDGHNRYGTHRFATIAATMTVPITLAKAGAPVAAAALGVGRFLPWAAAACLLAAAVLWTARTTDPPGLTAAQSLTIF
jgi:hypothetical protein